MMPAVHFSNLFKKILVQKGMVHSFAANFISRNRKEVRLVKT
jgi:hypothetical protein